MTFRAIGFIAATLLTLYGCLALSVSTLPGRRRLCGAALVLYAALAFLLTH